MSTRTSPAKRKTDAAVTSSNAITQQIDSFLASGGEIQKIPNGVSGQTWPAPRPTRGAR